MRKFVAALVLLFVFSSTSFSQVLIKKENRILNRSPGYCAWCCIETLGRHQNVEPLYNLVDKRAKEFTWAWDEKTKTWEKSPYVMVDYGNYKSFELRSPGPHRALANRLDELKVKYRYQNYYNYDKTLLKEAIKNKQGCLVVVKCYWGESNSNHDTHAIILLDYNEKGVHFLDPNDVENTYTATHKWFDYYWVGYVLLIDGVK